MISLIGMGSGCPESLTAQGLAALQSAGLILGAKRLLEHLPAGCTDNCKAVYKPEEILACLAAQPDTDTAVLYSGDTGFYSGAAKLLPLLRAMGYSVRVLPGLSSVQLLAAAVGRPWQDWMLVSAHGRACDPVAEVLAHPQVFFLTGGGDTPATLCAKLTAAGLGAAHALVGENLGTPAEAIRFGLARELAEQSFAPLSVLLIEREALPSRRTPGLPDDAFIRGAVPMTKQEVRAAALAKLAVTPTDTLWDVGAGTGSVSVELALAAPAGQVYAVECDPEACALIQTKPGEIFRLQSNPDRRQSTRCFGHAARPGCCIYRRHKGQYGRCYRRCAAQKFSCPAVCCRHCAGNAQCRRSCPDRPRPFCGGDTDRRQPHKKRRAVCIC